MVRAEEGKKVEYNTWPESVEARLRTAGEGLQATGGAVKDFIDLFKSHLEQHEELLRILGEILELLRKGACE